MSKHILDPAIKNADVSSPVAPPSSVVMGYDIVQELDDARRLVSDMVIEEESENAEDMAEDSVKHGVCLTAIYSLV